MWLVKTYRAVLGRAAVLLMLAAGTLPAEEVRLAGRLDAILNQHAAIGAIVHARVVKLPEREELYARNADKPCKPASNYKLLTTATGLDLFGPRHTFKTCTRNDTPVVLLRWSLCCSLTR